MENIISYTKKEIMELKQGDIIYQMVPIKQGWGTHYRHSLFKKMIVKSVSPKGNSIKTKNGDTIDTRSENVYHDCDDIHTENDFARNFAAINDIHQDLQDKNIVSIPDEYLQRAKDAYQALSDIYDAIKKPKGE